MKSLKYYNWELTKYDTETWSEKMVLKNSADRVAWRRIGTNLQFIKNAISVKFDKGKSNKMR